MPNKMTIKRIKKKPVKKGTKKTSKKAYGY